MNLFVRLFKLIILFCLNRKRLPLDAESTVHFRVWPNDLDINGHMNNGRYLTLMDLGRFELLLRAGLFWPAFKQKWNPILGSCQVRFRRSLKLFQPFSIKTKIVCWDQKWVYLEQRIESKGQMMM